MTRKRYNQALATGRPYFGSYMHSLQGNPVRHSYMDMMVAEVAARRKGRPISILELGSWAGGSAITWASALKFHNKGRGRVYCVDPWRPYLDRTINNGAVYDEMDRAANIDGIFTLFCQNISAAGFADVVIPLRGTSSSILPVLREKAFDIVFIDGDHHYDRVRQDIELAQKLVRAGGIICGDDLELQLSQCDRQAAEQLAKLGVDYVTDGKTGQEFHPGVTLAVNELLGEVSCWEGLWGMVRGPKGCEPLVFAQQGGSIPEHLRLAGEQAVVEDEPLTLIGDMSGYNIIRGPDGFIAVSQAMGDLRLLYETLGERPLPPMILLATDIDELHRQIETLSKTRCAHCEEAENLTRTAVSALRWRELEVEGLAKYAERLEADLAVRETEAAKDALLVERLDQANRLNAELAEIISKLRSQVEEQAQEWLDESASWQRHLQHFLDAETALSAEVSELSARVAQLHDVEMAQAAEISRLTDQVHHRDGEVAVLTDELTRRETRIASLDAEVAARDARIAAMEEGIASMEEGIASRDESIAAKDACIAAYQKMSRWDRFVARILGRKP